MDALRAFAAISVLVYHVHVIGAQQGVGVVDQNTMPGRFWAHLSVGVTVFFVISGFVLYRPWVASRAGEAPRPGVGSYARRRLLRILPAYWLALTVLTIAFHLPGVESGDWWRYYGLVQIYDPRTFAGGLGVAWTLCIEVSFYLVLPLYALLADRVARRAGHEILILTGLAVASWGWLFVVYHTSINPDYASTLLGTFDWFALGMILAVLSVHRVHVPTWPLVIAAIAMFAAPVVLSIHGAIPAHLIAGAFAVLAVSVAVLPLSPPAVLIWRPLAWLGLVSYGIYLWHATLIPPLANHVRPLDVWTLTVGTLIAAVAAAAASYYVLEKRAQHWRPGRKKPVVAQPVLALDAPDRTEVDAHPVGFRAAGE